VVAFVVFGGANGPDGSRTEFVVGLGGIYYLSSRMGRHDRFLPAGPRVDQMNLGLRERRTVLGA
jgi:hypothetical protein